jgi:hypothetical protein
LQQAKGQGIPLSDVITAADIKSTSYSSFEVRQNHHSLKAYARRKNCTCNRYC